MSNPGWLNQESRPPISEGLADSEDGAPQSREGREIIAPGEAMRNRGLEDQVRNRTPEGWQEE